MESIDIFTMALGQQAPWSVTKAELTGTDESARELHITIGFKKGHKFQVAGAEAQTAYDTVERTWRTWTSSSISATYMPACREYA